MTGWGLRLFVPTGAVCRISHHKLVSPQKASNQRVTAGPKATLLLSFRLSSSVRLLCSAVLAPALFHGSRNSGLCFFRQDPFLWVRTLLLFPLQLLSPLCAGCTTILLGVFVLNEEPIEPIERSGQIA